MKLMFMYFWDLKLRKRYASKLPVARYFFTLSSKLEKQMLQVNLLTCENYNKLLGKAFSSVQVARHQYTNGSRRSQTNAFFETKYCDKP